MYLHQDAYDTQGIVIADLSNLLISKKQANCIFQVLLQQFCSKEWNGDKPVHRKLVVFDEAHKYISNDGDGLAHEMLKVVRTMPHTGMRIVVSTQSPAELPHEMLALLSVMVVHRCNSHRVLHLLQQELGLSSADSALVPRLMPGQAMVYAGLADIKGNGERYCGPWYNVNVRRRLTRDGGVSVRHM
ncbi:hypothetical protein JKP88DRAFT_240834 [Tribonema minus]|uniref:Helicase HerA-like C-terminal domain-containing protein n=1 Tax=Tribonema minus TaxID=303371 RepID=A0A836CHY7_9STRA|nr:hypothetical protein JKP88DRAFT_240834 [Tribonema minus]